MGDDFDSFFGPQKGEPKPAEERAPASVTAEPAGGATAQASTSGASDMESLLSGGPTAQPEEGIQGGRAKSVEMLAKGPPADLPEPTPEETAKEVYLFFGDKNDGKTYAALSMPGKILALSFDYKTAIVKKKSYNNDPRITVYDALIREDYTSPEAELASSKTSMAYINQVLDNAKADPPDWILIDGSEIFQKLAESLMRYNNNITAFGGVQWTYWKERRFYIRQLHEKAIRLAKRGVIYTTYVDKDEIVVDGQIKARTDVPRWVDAVLYSVDEVIRVFPRNDANGRRYFARIEGSKLRPKNSGREFDITNKGVAGLLQ